MATKGLNELNEMSRKERLAYFNTLSREERMELADRLVSDCTEAANAAMEEQRRLSEKLEQANDLFLEDLGKIVKAYIHGKEQK